MHQIISFAICCALSSLALATDGDLDLSFGDNGKVITDFFDRTDVGSNLLIDQNGHIILAGSASKSSISDHFAMARYKNDGSLDENFGDRGRVVTRNISNNKVVFDGIMGLGRSTDGRLIASGRGIENGAPGFAVLAYDSNGAIDKSFRGEGALFIPDQDREIYPLALAIDAHDRIVIAAAAFKSDEDSYFAIFRFNKDGNADEFFGEHGRVFTRVTGGVNVPRAMKIDVDGSIIVGGFNGLSKFVVAKYHDNGDLNFNFGAAGIATIVFNHGGTDTLSALAIQADQKIVVGGDVQVGSIGGFRTVDFGLARLTKDGQLDLSFNKTGKQITYFAKPEASSLWALTLQSDGKIIAVGDASIVNGLGVARYNLDGSLDKSFADEGKQIVTFEKTCHWEALALQADNKIIAGGYVWNGKHYDMALVRLHNSEPTKN